MNRVNTVIKENRLKNNWTQEELANKLNVSISLIRMYENGTRNPSDKVKESLCQLFNISISELFEKNQTDKLQQSLNEQISTRNLKDEEFNVIKEILITSMCDINNMFYYIKNKRYVNISPSIELNKTGNYIVLSKIIRNCYHIIRKFFYSQISNDIKFELDNYIIDEETTHIKIAFNNEMRTEIEEIFEEIKNCIEKMEKVDIPNYMIPIIPLKYFETAKCVNYNNLLEHFEDLLEMPISIEANKYYAIKIENKMYIIKLDNNIIENEVYFIRKNNKINATEKRIGLYTVFNSYSGIIIQDIDNHIPRDFSNKDINSNNIDILGRVVATISII